MDFWSKNRGSKQFLASKNVGPENLSPKKYWIQKRPKKVGAKKDYLVKLGSVTVRIFLIWTNVARTNIAWTNVTVTVGIC